MSIDVGSDLIMPNDNSLPTLSVLWVEGGLSYIEHICLKSMLAQGHEVHLYHYGDVFNVPDGVTLKNAEVILPRSKLLRHKKTGSYALGADIFRYELLRKEKTIWLDADVYCLKPFHWFDGFVFGWEDELTINNAVLGIPSDHRVLDELKDYYDADILLPPWWSKHKKIRNILRSLIGMGKTAADAGWGVLGPKAITYFSEKTGIAGKAQDREVFYPIPYETAAEIFDPKADPMRFVSEKSLTIHLWNESIKDRKKAPPPKGSLMHRLCLEQGLSMKDIKGMLSP